MSTFWKKMDNLTMACKDLQQLNKELYDCAIYFDKRRAHKKHNVKLDMNRDFCK